MPTLRILTILLGIAAAPPAATQLQYSATADLVVVNVHVTDEDGAPVTNLTAENFEVFEDGRPQPVVAFSDADAPVTVGLVIDSSISMWAIRDQLVTGATAFARASHPENEMFAIAFNDARWPALPPSAAFTSDPDLLGRALARVVQPRGRTGLYDALLASLAYIERGHHPRKVLVVLSDGGDNASEAKLEDVVRQTEASDVVIHGVALVDPLDRAARPEVLRDLARATGGETFRPATMADVEEALQRVARDIRTSYLIGYAPAASTDGEHHTIKVVAKAADRGDLRVRTREGYRREPVPRTSGHDAP